MTDHIRERLKNPGLRLAREIAERRLKLAGVKLSKDWSRRHWTVEGVAGQAEESFSPDLVRRLAGG